MTKSIDISFFSKNSWNHEREIDSFSSWIAKVDSFESWSKLIKKKFWVFSLSLIHIDGGSVNEPISLILDDFFDGRMAMADIHLSIIWLQVKIAVTLMVEKVLHVTLGNDEWIFVVSLIEIREMLQPFGNDLIGITGKGLRSVVGGRKLESGEQPSK